MTKRGFTLIELLLALAIMSSVIALSVVAFRVTIFQGQSDATIEKLRLDELITFHRISASIRSATSFYMRDRLGESRLVGQGNDRGFAFVSTKPVLLNERLVLASLMTRTDQRTGNRYIEYCEYPIVPLEEQRYDECWSDASVRYVDNMRAISFEFFGWPNRFSQLYSSGQQVIAISQGPSWRSEFDAKNDGIMPFYMRINLNANGPSVLPNVLFFKLTEEDPRVVSTFAGAADE